MCTNQSINERFVVTPAVPEVAVTVDQVYGKPLACLKPPKGYEFTEFRKVNKNDSWLDPTAKCSVTYENESTDHFENSVNYFVGRGVRLILKKKEPRKVIKHVFTETGENRRINDGEHYIANNGDIYLVQYGTSVASHPVVKYERIEEMVED